MSLIAKAGIIGLALLGVGGAGIWLMNYLSMPDFRTLDQDSDFSGDNSPYKDKYGSIYGKYMVGVSDEAKADSKDKDIKNDDWWKWSYGNEKRFFEKAGGKFKQVKDANSLKETCKSAYKEENKEENKEDSSGKIKETAPSSQGDEEYYLESDIWKFCSVLGKKPVTIAKQTDETYSTTNAIGSKEENKKVLISVKSEDNGWAWIYQQALFNDSVSESDKFFFKLKKEKLLKDICKDAYGMVADTTTSSETKPTEAEVKKYCSIS